MNTPSPLTIVIGGRGKTGRRVVARLESRGLSVRPVSRTTAIAFDWDDSATWRAALAGADRAYVTYSPDLAAPGSHERIVALGAAACEMELGRLVLLSGRGEPEAQRCEDALLASGVDATIVRSSFFAQNFSEDFLVDAIRAGEFALPAGDVAEPIVDADDIADVVVAALTEPGHAGRVHEVTGPRLLTFHDVAEALSRTTGRPIRYRPVTASAYAAEAIAAGVPPDEATILADLFAHIFDGHNASLTDGVDEVLGRPARTFADYAADAAATGVWDR